MKSHALLLGALALTSCASIRPRPDMERIVFSSSRTGNGDIYIANADGSGLRRLTANDQPELMPRCSPDRRYLLFVRGTTQSGDLYRLDLRTGAELRLTNDPLRDSTPEWSTDGRRIYFTRRDGRFDRIATIAADGGVPEYLTDGANHDVMPAVSPDNRYLVHHSYRYGRDTELQMLDLKSGTTRRLTSHSGSDYEAVFGGRRVVIFSSNRGGGHYRLYRQALGDGSAQLLADTGADAWSPRYSARLRQVLFYTGKPGSWQVMRVPASGGTPEPLLADGHVNMMADWC